MTCQIIRVEQAAERTLVDLVTLEPSTHVAGPAPAGTPMVLDFGSGVLGANRLALALLLTRWEQASAVLHVTVDDDPAGRRYDFCCGKEHLTVVVDDGPGGR